MKRRFLLIVCLIFAFMGAMAFVAGCTDPENETPSAEVGEYYYDAGGTEYLLTLKTGKKFTLAMGADNKSGTYTLEGEALTLNYSEGDPALASYAGNSISLPYGDTTYNFLKKVDFTVKFETDGGSRIADVTVLNGKTISAPDDPEKAGSVFVGWYTDNTHRNAFYFSQPVKDNLTLYALFVEKLDPEFTARFDLNYEDAEAEKAPAPQETAGRRLYRLPTPERDGATFVGWYVSHFADSTKLTYEYTDQVLAENVTLYAVWEEDGAPVVSVTEAGVAVRASGANNSFNIKITAPDGSVKEEQQSGNGTLAYDFAGGDAGEYTVEVTLNGKSVTRYYNNKALARVSVFTVEGSLLMFNAVENAQNYKLTVLCGSESHEHNDIDLRTQTSWSFANCDMREGGIAFTVTASGEGYLPSTSETFYFTRTLDQVANLAIDKETESVTWDAVEKATGYFVEIKKGTETLYSENIGDVCSFDFKPYGAGEYRITVQPYARGWSQPEAAVLAYTKTRSATPANVRIEGSSIVWDAIEGVNEYEIEFDGQKQTVTGTSFDYESVAAGKTSFTFRVRAKGSSEDVSSLWSDAITFRSGSLDEIRYSAGKVSWDPLTGVSGYEITVGDAAPVTVRGSETSYAVTFTQKGKVVISVSAIFEDGGVSTPVTTTVDVYALEFNIEGAEAIAPQYYADGDPLALPQSPTRYGYNFGGWYTAPGGPNGEGNSYDSERYFNGNSDRSLYAYWSPKLININFNLGRFGDTADWEARKITGQAVLFGSEFTLPVPESTDPTRRFEAWHLDSDAGLSITDFQGKGKAFTTEMEGGVTVYASYQVLYVFEEVEGGYSVSRGPAMDYVTEARIPAYYRNQPVTQIGDFSKCALLERLYIPDTVIIINLGTTAVAFSGCTKLNWCEIYEVEGNTAEKVFSSQNGVLMRKNSASGDLELRYVPYGMTGVLNVPEGVTTIVEGAYYTRSNIGSGSDTSGGIERVNIPSSVTSVARGAFAFCSSLREVYFEPDGSKTDLKPLTIDPMMISNNGKYVLYENQSVYASNGSYLTKITLPKRIADTFTADTLGLFRSLTTIEIEEGGALSMEGGLVIRDKGAEGKEVVFATPRDGDVEQIKNFVIPAGVNSIGEKAFYYNTTVRNITIPNWVTKIGAHAFEGCYLVETLKFEGTETDQDLSVGDRAFYFYYGRKYKPESGTTSDSSIPSSNSKVTELILPANLVAIGEQSFGEMSQLKDVTVNAARTQLNYSEGAFNNRSNSAYVQTVRLGPSCPMFDVSGVFGNAVKQVIVDDQNPYYSTDEQGVLFAKDAIDPSKRSIAFFPTAFEGAYTIPEDIFEIPASCFARRTNLTGITLHSKITKIGDQAFYLCTSLKDVTFVATPDGEEPVELTIGASAFYGCDEIVTLSLPERVKTLGASVFKSCTSLTELVLPASLEKIEATTTGLTVGAIDAFDDCDSLSKLTVAEGSKYFATDGGVLYALKGVYKDAETKEIEYVPYELIYCPVGVSGTVKIPGSVHIVDKYAFNHTDKVQEIVFENTKEYLAPGTPTEEEPDPADETIPAEIEVLENAFYYCGGLTKVTFGHGLKTMRTRIFYSCNKLDTVTISNTVTSIQPDVFYVGVNSSSLAHIYFEDGGNDPLRIEDGTQTTSGTGPVDTYYHGAFGNLDKLEEIEFPSRLAYLGNNAFRMDSPGSSIGKSSSLATIKFKDLKEGSTLEIGTYVFYGAPLTGEVKLPEGLTKIGNYAFYLVSARDNGAKISLPSTVETIGGNAFSNRHFADEFVIPASVTSIGVSAFSQTAARATSTTKVVIADNSQLESIGNGAFSSFVNVTSFEFSKNVNAQGEVAAAAETENRALLTLGSAIFSGMTKLQSIVLPSNLKVIGANEFSGLTSLSSITWEDPDHSAIESIGTSAFSRTAIERFDFPTTYASAGTIKLDANLFMFCNKLTTVSLSASISDVNNVFTGCSALQTIEISDDNTYLSSRPPIVYNKEGNIVKFVCGAYNKDNGIFQIPEGGTEIGGGAFNAQTEIVEIRIPASVQKIGDNAFANCVSLKRVVFAKGSVLQEIGKAAFLNCSSLESINLEDCNSLTTLGAGTSSDGGVFAGCKNLKSLKFGSALTTIGSYQFEDHSYVEEVDFSACGQLQELPSYLFQDNIYIKSVKFPSSITFFGGTYTFDGCTNLSRINSDEEGTIDLSGLTNLQYLYSSAKPAASFKPETSTGTTYTFQDCTSIKKVILPESLEFIGGSAFKNCTSLTEIVGLENVIGLASSSIFQNTGLTSVTIGSGVKTLGSSLFQGCAQLTSITFEAPENFSTLPGSLIRDCTSLTEFDLTQFENVTSLNTYIFSGSGVKKVDLSSFKTIKSLPNYLFWNCTELEEVILPKADDGAVLNYLGTYTFQGCTKLSKINSDEAGTFDLSGISLTLIGTSATAASTTGKAYTFDGCEALKKVILPEKCTKLAGWVFSNCPNLTDINFDQLVQIGTYAFSNTGFSSLVIPKTVTSWAEGAFMYCEKLTRVQLASGFTSLGSKWIFAECPNLAEVVVPTSITHLGTYTFQNDVNLTRIIASDKTETDLEVDLLSDPVGTFDFSKATKLTRLSSGATTAVSSSTDSYVFAGCLGLKEFKASASLVQVAGYAFDGCANLQSFDFSNLTNLGRYAFRGTGITEVKFGDKLSTSVYYAPFQDCENLTKITVPTGNTNVKFENGMLLNAKTNAVIMAIPNLILTSEDGTLTISDETTFSSNAFQGGFNGVTKLDLSKLTITSIPTYAFADAGFKQVVLPATVTSIGTYAFSNSALESIDFNGAKVTSIGNYAFQGTALTEFTVPNTVTSLGYGTFYNCKQLQTVTFEDGAPEGAEEETLVTIGAGGSSAPKNDGSSETRGVFEDSSVQKVVFHRVAKVPVRGFANAKSLKEIEYGDEVNEIGGYYTFYGCESYTSLRVPDTVTTIGAYAFAYSCFTEVTIPGTVTSMSSYSFADSKVVTVTFEKGDPEAPLPTTMYNTFRECADLKNVDLGNRFTVLAYDFFTDCVSLETLVIPEGVTEFTGLCLGCIKLSSLTLPESLTTIGATRHNFENTPSLKNIVIPANVNSINKDAFAGMTKDQTVTFKNTRFSLVQSINSALFIANSDANFVFEPLA